MIESKSRLSANWLAFGVGVALAVAAIAYALTQDQIWNAVYDSATQSLQVNLQ